MKRKCLAFFSALSLLPALAYADVDLSSMSYEDLTSLSHQLTSEMMSRPECQSITLPLGLWRVGIDIPVGDYLVTPEGDGPFSDVVYGSVPDSTGNAMSYLDKGNVGERLKAGESWKLSMSDGMLLYVAYHSVVLSPLVTP